MSRIRIRTIRRLRRGDVRRLVTGYVSDAVYVARPDPRPGGLGVRLERVPLAQPFRKRFPLPPREWVRYRGFVQQHVSLGAYDGRRLVGLALVEARKAEGALWVWELGVAETHRRRGIGTSLLRELEREARDSGYRTIRLETQTTNVPALDFYARNGFTTDRIDPDFYPKRLRERGEIAVFLSKRVRPQTSARKRTATRHKRSTRRYQARRRG